MEPYKIVEIIMITFAIFYVILEVILNLNDLDNDTSNVLLLQWSNGKLFFIPFVLGAIGGHLFLGTKDPSFDLNPMLPVAMLFGVVIVMVIIAFLTHFKKTKLLHSILLALGLLYGHLFWSMNIIN